MCFWAPFLPVNRSPSFWTPFCLSSQPFVARCAASCTRHVPFSASWQRYNFFGLVPLFATTHPPICSQVTLDLLPPLVVPPLLRPPPQRSLSPLRLCSSFPCSLVGLLLTCCFASGLCLVFLRWYILPKIWLQKGLGQNLAKNGRSPMIPEGAFTCRPASRQSIKIWRQKGLGQNLAKNGRFPMIPEGVFNCRPKASNGRNLLPKGSWPRFGTKGPFPNDPRRRL